MQRSADVLVLGGGPAGLAAAWWAGRRGKSVVLLERGETVGGLAASFDVCGVSVDHGSHRLHAATAPAVLADLKALLGHDLQLRPRRGRVQVANRWVTFPPSPLELVRKLPPGLSARLARDVALAPFRRPRADTYAEAVRTSVGPTLGEVLYFPMAYKLWDAAPGDLAGEQARRRISASSPGAVVRRMLGRTTPSFFYPRRGFGQIVDCLADAAAANHADIHTSVDVTRVELGNDDGARVMAADGSVFEAPVLLSTIPLASLVRLIDPPAPEVVAAATERSTTRAMVLVYVVLSRPQWTSFDAHYLPSRRVLPTRVSEPKNYRSGDDPADRTVLCVEIPCWPGDETWNAPDRAIGGRVVDDIAGAGLPEVGPAAVEVRRVPSVYPVYRPGVDRDLALIEAWLGTFPKLVTLGRQGLFAHDNTHHTLEMAREAVGALRDDGTIDRARWSLARDRFRAHVVED